MQGLIFNIQRFCINDGPGIRTTVFLKGCPLRCLWCHNPESQTSTPTTLFYKEKCVECGECKSHSADNSDFLCPNNARELCGKWVEPDEVMSEVLKDEVFYRQSGGGMTLSGGEPFYQTDFSVELLRMAKKSNIHTAIETCGYTDKKSLEALAEYTDLFLWDCKETDTERHVRFTGVDNRQIIENLCLINDMKKSIVLRCPIIPRLNDREEHFEKIAAIANSYDGISHIEIAPYHPLGEAKYAALGRKTITVENISDEIKQSYLQKVRCFTEKEVKFV